MTILARDKGLCALRLAGCTTTATHVDHIQPLSKGGSKYDPSNCRAACASCNLKRGNSVPVAQPECRPTSRW